MRREVRIVTLAPHVAANDLAVLVPLLLDSVGSGVPPTVFRLDLMREGLLVEAMPAWRLHPEDLTLVHLGGRLMQEVVRAFKDFAASEAPKLLGIAP